MDDTGKSGRPSSSVHSQSDVNTVDGYREGEPTPDKVSSETGSERDQDPNRRVPNIRVEFTGTSSVLPLLSRETWEEARRLGESRPGFDVPL